MKTGLRRCTHAQLHTDAPAHVHTPSGKGALPPASGPLEPESSLEWNPRVSALQVTNKQN